MIRLILCLWLFLAACSLPKEDASWCSHELRKEFLQFEEVKTSQPWFRVFRVGKDVYAIAEPYNFQEVISYLIVGKQRSILFDTGMGMGKISTVISELSANPVTVVNSHTHYDHIGGNHEFKNVLAVDTAYTRKFASNGWSHDQVEQEVQPSAFCREKLPLLDTDAYSIQPYADNIRGYLTDGDTIALGERTLEVMRVPGHTPDCVALIDKANGYLWTGDMFYEATIWLFFEGSDLDAYRKSISRFAKLAPSLKTVFPAHNKPTADPSHLIDLEEAFSKILKGEIKGSENTTSSHPEDKKALTFKFEHFSFLIRKDLLP